ncbi:MAG: PLP-dependent aminotransferase family protein [Candidatus Promineifilaceae bacterium]|nr:PLP-dependent aminotransferase family protein [Candidatus Promineifilaceae bacterium]
MTTPWTRRYAQRMQWMGSSVIRELLKLTQQPDIISFAGGLPAPELFPVKAFAEATDKVLAEHGSQALQYSTTEGYRPLRELIVERMSRYGIPARPENVLLTSGSQQALDLIGKLLINPGDLVLTEEPSYLGAIQAWRAYQAEFVTVPIDDDGLCCAGRLEQALCAGPKFMYILPNFHNPAGVTLAGERRRRIIRIADNYGIPIVEDDPYGQLRYEGEHLPPLLVLDARQLNGEGENGRGRSNGSFLRGNVIYLSTFSKTLAPGLRLGWIVAPEEVVQKCVMAKQGMDLHTSTLIQMVTYEVARDGFLDKHVATLRRVYRRRRDLMLEMMARHFPPEVRWTRPEGGLFLWVTLPETMDSPEVLKKAIEHKVAYVPGTAFYPAGGGHNTLRLNFSNARPEMIELGIRRLGEVFGAELERSGRVAEPASL